MKPHRRREMVNNLTETAQKYAGTEQLREQIAYVLGDAMDEAQPGSWGRGDLMAIAAVRYCLGRTSYITCDCRDWLVAEWANIKPSARGVIQGDIEEAFRRDDEARASWDRLSHWDGISTGWYGNRCGRCGKRNENMHR